MDSSVAEFLASNQTTRVRIPIRAFWWFKMETLDKKIERCPLRHPLPDGKGSVCFYSSEKCNHTNVEQCKVYLQIGRGYASRVQEYQQGSSKN